MSGEGPQIDWEDADRLILALMRLDARIDAIEAKLDRIERLLDEDDGEEEEENF